jgi:hypothetical protein
MLHVIAWRKASSAFHSDRRGTLAQHSLIQTPLGEMCRPRTAISLRQEMGFALRSWRSRRDWIRRQRIGGRLWRRLGGRPGDWRPPRLRKWLRWLWDWVQVQFWVHDQHRFRQPTRVESKEGRRMSSASAKPLSQLFEPDASQHIPRFEQRHGNGADD